VAILVLKTDISLFIVVCQPITSLFFIGQCCD
jgi:hypothetical protein